jgi:hypothetical protein
MCSRGHTKARPQSLDQGQPTCDARAASGTRNSLLPRLPCWCFVTITSLQGCIVTPEPNPQPGGPGLRIYDLRRQGDPAIPQALGTHFSRLLRHAWVTVGLLFNPGNNRRDIVYFTYRNEYKL